MTRHSNIFASSGCISEEMLVNYASGCLSSAQKHEVEMHLTDCAMCSDAVEGLQLMPDQSHVPGIIHELNRKIQAAAAGRKDGKMVFFYQYRTQLAVAASLILILGLIWLFRSNLSMSEMDSASAEKMFADKFEAPPSDLDQQPDEQKNEEKKSNIPEGSTSPPIEQVQPISSSSPEIKEVERSMQSEKNSGWIDNVSAPVEEMSREQESAQTGSHALLKEKSAIDDRYKSTNALTQSSSAVINDKESKARDEDWISSKDKSKVDAGEYQPITTTSGAAAGVTSKQETDKSGGLAAGNTASVLDERNQPANKKTSKKESERGDVLSIESRKKTFGKSEKKAKEQTPQKPFGAYETQLPTSTQPAQSPKATENVQSESPAADSTTMAFSSGIADVSLFQEAAMEKYNKEDYPGAASDFEQVLRKNPNDDKSLFYAGVSYLGSGQVDKAVSYLTRILQNKSSKFYDDAQWYLSLAYIKKKDAQNARANLMELKSNSKSKYQKQADETLKEMNK